MFDYGGDICGVLQGIILYIWFVFLWEISDGVNSVVDLWI